jgi:hypothetical protein
VDVGQRRERAAASGSPARKHVKQVLKPLLQRALLDIDAGRVLEHEQQIEPLQDRGHLCGVGHRGSVGVGSSARDEPRSSPQVRCSNAPMPAPHAP